MTTELALKHKDSLVLKEDKLYSEKPQVRKYIFKKTRNWQELSFPWLILIVFVLFWIFVPLLWLICYSIMHIELSNLPFWTVVFIVWVAVTCGTIVLWKRLEAKRNRETTLRYGSDHREGPHSSIPFHMTSESGKLAETKKINIDEESEKNDRNLPVLTIHKRASGENENRQVEEDEKVQRSDVADCKDRPFQDNLKLVTVSSSEDEVKTPMSPRELFFIDLIREAEKAESAKSLKTKTHFFPNETTEDGAKDVRNVEDVTQDAQEVTEVKDAEDTKDTKDENEKTSELKSKHQSSYFIANVENSIGEKTEMFLQINSSVHEQTELSAENLPTLKSNEENLQEASS